MSDRRFAIRTVQDGAVKIGGRTFRPRENHRAYDGRLDGLRMAFARYREYTDNGESYQPVVHLWGTEAAYKGTDESLAGPHVVDGTLPWDWWEATDG